MSTTFATVEIKSGAHCARDGSVYLRPPRSSAAEQSEATEGSAREEALLAIEVIALAAAAFQVFGESEQPGAARIVLPH